MYWCFSFLLTLLYIIGSSFIYLIRIDSHVSFFFYSWVIFHGVYVPQLPYPFVCWWTSRLLQCPSYSIVLYSIYFTFTSRHNRNWASFPLWPSCFILSGAISNCPLLFPGSILGTFKLGGLIFWHHISFPFHIVHGILQARILEWVVISFSIGPRFVRTRHYDPSVLGGRA